MGAVSVSNTCIDGTQQATITATNGTTTVLIDGLETHTLDVGPGPHVVVWLGAATNGDGTTDPLRIVEWNRTIVDVPVLDCTPDTTSTQAAPTTSEATTGTTAPTTTLPVSSSVPSTNPATTRALDLDTVPATIAEVGHARELPATGSGIEGPIAAGLATIIGLALLTVRRRPA